MADPPKEESPQSQGTSPHSASVDLNDENSLASYVRRTVQPEATPKRELHADDKAIIIAVGGSAFCAGLFGFYESHPILGVIFTLGGLFVMATVSPFVHERLPTVGRPALWAVNIVTWLFLAANIGLSLYEKHVATEAAPTPAVVVHEGSSPSDITKATKPFKDEIVSLKNQLAAEDQTITRLSQNWDIPFGPRSPGPLNPLVANDIAQAFKTAKGPCLVKITSGSDNENLRESLGAIAVNLGGCVEQPEPFPPNIDQKRSTNKSAGIIIHFGVNNELGPKVAKAINESGLITEITNTFPSWDEPNLIWLDIGPGRPWRF